MSTLPTTRHRTWLALAVATFTFAFGAPLAHAGDQPYTLDTARKLVNAGGVQPSPDGRSVAFTVTRPDYGKDANLSELWIADIASGNPRQLTWDRKHVGEARWSPDGQWIGFVAADADDHSQVWLLPVRGGEARQLTHAKTDVEHYAWRPDGKAIAYVAADTAVTRTGEDKALTTFTVGAQDLFLRTNARPRHIWLQSLEPGDAKRLTSGTWSVEFVLPPSSPPSHLSWSPDGRTIAFAQVPAAESGKLDSVHVALLDIDSGAIRALDGAKRFQNNPQFSPDGTSLTYWFPRDGRGDAGYVNELYMAPLTGGGKSLTRALDRNLFNGDFMPDGKTVLVAANDRTTTGVWLQTINGSAKRLELGDLVVNGAFGYDIQPTKTGAIVFSASTATRPSEVYVLDSPTAKPRRLTDFNNWITAHALGHTETVTWTNDGLAEDGVLIHPANEDPAKSYPLVLVIHGGPTSASKGNFNSMGQMMANEGWYVFMPNYRGSDNLGNTYQSAIHGDWGPGPGRDVMAGVAELRKRSSIDKARTAVTGWSYGGYMTSWLIGNYPNEWRAAMAGAPVTSWLDQYDLSDGNISLKNDMGGSPWVNDHAEFYKQQSPITYATKAKAPTLVMANIEDFRVPPSQAMSLYRALQDNGVESKFVAFQGRTHASADPVNARERTRLWIEWVKQHMEKPATNLP
jgi:dipeptidyl aminopeptidase/acylaminoacyl peptidase